MYSIEDVMAWVWFAHSGGCDDCPVIYIDVNGTYKELFKEDVRSE